MSSCSRLLDGVSLDLILTDWLKIYITEILVILKVHGKNVLEGNIAEMKWAIWRRNQDDISGDIDDEEDKADEDCAIIAKTLKNTASRTELEKLIKEVLIFHCVPSHPNLAQVFFLFFHAIY